MPKDKWLHLFSGALVSSVVFFMLGPTLAMLASVVVGVGKELFDLKGNGTPELADAVVTIIGGVLAVLFLSFI